jgi:hypothetical protein
MPVIALAAFVIVKDLSDTRNPVEQRVFEAVLGWGDRAGDLPYPDMQDMTVREALPVIEESLGRRHPNPPRLCLTIT